MKKTNILLLASLMTLGAYSSPVFAQEEVAPNRLLMTDKNGYFDGYSLEYIDEITFANVEGVVEAPVKVLSVPNLSTIELSVSLSEACKYFRLSLDLTLQTERMNDIAVIRYVENYGTAPEYEGFESGTITGFNLKPGTDYTVLTVGYDEYDTPVGVSRASFTTDAVEIVGDPYVKCEFLEIGYDYFIVSFEPNEYVSEYYYMLFEAGTADEYLAMWGPPFGCTTISELIEMWWMGRSQEDPITIMFDEDVDPGTAYDMIVAVKDVNGNFIPHETIPFTTLSYGGSGMSYVDIELGSYNLEMWNGLQPSQFISFKPNDETARYRFAVYFDYEYERFGEELVEELMQEPPQPGIAYWWFFDPIYTDFQINPSTTFYVIAAGQNALNEWGEPNVQCFTTPDTCPGWTPPEDVAVRSASNPEAKVAAREMKKNVAEGVKAMSASRFIAPKKITIKQK